ncbi:ABC transporter permease [Solicola gregarius]|uniref:ABC transporter permease n=1 Tax=Solicola gregarius TaxID=2908642 RepID=A0AA46YKG8_9ACTN|nr:ABC transporter permease [Solicola gregarius]UYM03958.1 ABC transporter permease [Solicola gregarius]
MSVDQTVAEPAEAPVSPAERSRTRRITTILAIATALLLLMWWKTESGDFTFLLQPTSSDTDEISVSTDGKRLVMYCTIIAIVGLVLFAAKLARRGALFGALMALVGVAFIVGFCAWAYSGQDTPSPLPMTNPLEGTVQYATPLVLGALCGAMCERAGVINVGIEAQFLAGAFFASVSASLAYSAWMGLVGGIGAGIAIGALLALFAIRYLVNQVVLGVVLVVFATGITGFLLDQIPSDQVELLNSPPILATWEIPGLSELPVVGAALFAQNWLVYIMYLSVPVAWFLLFQTRWGLRVRAVGEHPTAADTVGIKVRGRRWQAVLVGGIFAGLGGAFYTVGSTGAFDKDVSAGTGFIALAALIMGRWHPVGAALAALFFGFVSQLQTQLQILAKLPTELLAMTPYLATIIVVAGFVGRAIPPAADGEPYVKS